MRKVIFKLSREFSLRAKIDIHYCILNMEESKSMIVVLNGLVRIVIFMQFLLQLFQRFCWDQERQ